jgi:hypothetical protein
VGGRTPIELFVERQPDPAAPHCRRMLRWSDEAFAGLFQVAKVSLPRLWLTDLEDGREYEVFSTRPEALRRLRQRELLFTRLAPWDDQWVLSGVQQKWGMPSAEDLDGIREKLKFAPPHRRTNADDPALRKAAEVQAEQYAAWVEFFGADELVFPSGREMQDAINRFTRHWSQEVRDPATGMTRAERYERGFDRPAPDADVRLPDELLRSLGPGVVFDRLHGMILLASYGRVRDLFEADAPPRAVDAAMVLEYLRDPSVHPVVLQRLCDRHPARAQDLIRSALRDREFDLGRDFDLLLRKYKGGHMHGPPRPGVLLVEQKQPLTQ